MPKLIEVPFFLEDIFLDGQSLSEESQLFAYDIEQVELKTTVPTKPDLDIDMRYRKLKPTQRMTNNVMD